MISLNDLSNLATVAEPLVNVHGWVLVGEQITFYLSPNLAAPEIIPSTYRRMIFCDRLYIEVGASQITLAENVHNRSSRIMFARRAGLFYPPSPSAYW